MNPYRQQSKIDAARAETGWAYRALPWFSPDEIEHAERQRGKLLESLGGALRYSFNGTKPHVGPLSIGCQLCGTPAGVFHFINSACTRACAFCPQDRSKNTESLPSTDGIDFEDDEAFAEFISRFGIRRVGITGGEPLLALRRLLSRMYTIGERSGKDVYFWMNTNGDLADRSTLARLSEAGLNEIRFNISARDYDMEPVRRAKEYIPVVTVEIPAIPEDIEAVKKSMIEMEKMGVDFLNLIQLEVSEDNYRTMDLSRYHVCHREFMLPVFESEICALRLMLFREENRMRLPVSYCGFPYRFDVTDAQRSIRYNQCEMSGWEDITEAGYIRTLSLRGSSEEIVEAERRLEKTTEKTQLWWCDEGKTELLFHRKLFPIVVEDCSSVVIRYEEKTLSEFSASTLRWKRRTVAEAMLSRWAARCWHQIYVEQRNEKEATRAFVKSYPITPTGSLSLLAEEKRVLKEIGIWERLEVAYPEPLF